MRRSEKVRGEDGGRGRQEQPQEQELRRRRGGKEMFVVSSGNATHILQQLLALGLLRHQLLVEAPVLAAAPVRRQLVRAERVQRDGCGHQELQEDEVPVGWVLVGVWWLRRSVVTVSRVDVVVGCGSDAQIVDTGKYQRPGGGA